MAEGDCDDNDGWINPSLDEICGDGIDNDCDDVVDEDCVDDRIITEAGGCNCRTTGGMPTLWPLLGVLLLLRRRRSA